MANTFDKVYQVASSEVGYLEKKSNGQLEDKTANAGDRNYTKYWAKMNPSYQGQPWCQAFVNYCFVMAFGEETAKKLLCTDGEWSYYTPTSANYFKAKKQWYTDPKVGDIIYFKNSTRIHHVGIVIGVSDSIVTTIEGNTGSGKSVIANGGGVHSKVYERTNPNIAGYGRPQYDTDIKNGWLFEDGWYYYQDGKKLKKEWIKSKNCWYRLGTDGKMLTGLHKIYDKDNIVRSYYFGEDGALWHESDIKDGSLEKWIDKENE